jgi:hypothetical protein
MRRITRDRRLTPEEAAKYTAVREQVAQELPQLICRHHERLAALDQLQGLLAQLKAARIRPESRAIEPLWRFGIVWPWRPGRHDQLSRLPCR